MDDSHYVDPSFHSLIGQVQDTDAEEFEKRLAADRKAREDIRLANSPNKLSMDQLVNDMLEEATPEEKEQELNDQLDQMDKDIDEAVAAKTPDPEDTHDKFPAPPITV